jgi:hypothetical protein
MTLEALKQAIGELTAEEREALATWLYEQQMDGWDREMQRDFSPVGRGASLVEKVKADIHAGKFRPMDERPAKRGR